MRTDELGNKCPETLGEYRDLCVIVGLPGNKAVVFLDKKIAESPHGREEQVLESDLQMRDLLMPMLIELASQDAVYARRIVQLTMVEAKLAFGKIPARFKYCFQHQEVPSAYIEVGRTDNLAHADAPYPEPESNEFAKALRTAFSSNLEVPVCNACSLIKGFPQ